MLKSTHNVKENDLRKFADIIISSDTHKQMIQRLNGLKAGYKRGKNISQTTLDRIQALEFVIIKFK